MCVTDRLKCIHFGVGAEKRMEWTGRMAADGIVGRRSGPRREAAARPLAPPILWTGRRWTIALLLLIVATFVIRARYFGNPFIDVDEEFYLLTGDRMLHGAIPYVDIWDRKPVGLFLLYAAIRLLGGDGILAYQIVAAGFVAATAVVIALLARRISSPGAALIAALAYVPALAMNGGAGGQTPVFYNLLMALAALVIVRRIEGPSPDAPTLGSGVLAMLLVGVAMQIKYSAVFEGAFFGLALLWRDHVRATPVLRRLVHAILWAGTALLPTLAAWLTYAAIGHGPDFFFANFTSISARGSVAMAHQMSDLRHIIVRLVPFMIPVAVGVWLRREGAKGSTVYRFVLGWLAAAVVGFAAFGTFFDHYALPLLVPLAIAASPAFAVRDRRVGMALAAILLVPVFVAYPLNAAKQERKRGDAAYARLLTTEIAPALHGRCLYVFFGEPILYQLTHSCLPTRWPFPFHLSIAREAPAIGVDPMAETARIMATRPPVVIDRLNTSDEINWQVQAYVRGVLRREYRLAFAHPFDGDVDQVWIRR